ncbi:hypothetical protein Pint_23614 [Pistacia integerrima]|uniref:Uncharacterized protein n=1 Tax=Pistacia integerrima TaxID=434235 RepID=A0ACC0YN62_9ROSI|nr:hypothetical protein Pint_23614 [Pistacia integerrima]
MDHGCRPAGRTEGLGKAIAFELASKGGKEIGKLIEEGIEGLDIGILINVVGENYPTARSVLPIMISKRKGAIVNIGSGSSAIIPSSPLFTLYASTKCYMDQLSRSLYVPGYCVTKMTLRMAAIKEPSLFIPMPEDFARASVRMIGYEPRCSPYWAHALLWGVSIYVPDTVLDTFRLAEGIRRRSQGKTD